MKIFKTENYHHKSERIPFAMGMMPERSCPIQCTFTYHVPSMGGTLGGQPDSWQIFTECFTCQTVCQLAVGYGAKQNKHDFCSQTYNQIQRMGAP